MSLNTYGLGSDAVGCGIGGLLCEVDAVVPSVEVEGNSLARNITSLGGEAIYCAPYATGSSERWITFKLYLPPVRPSP